MIQFHKPPLVNWISRVIWLMHDQVRTRQSALIITALMKIYSCSYYLIMLKDLGSMYCLIRSVKNFKVQKNNLVRYNFSNVFFFFEHMSHEMQ